MTGPDGSPACRICRRPLPSAPAFELDPVPRSAQGLPGADELAGETGAALRVFQCGDCGLVQLASAPVPYFREVITAAAWSPKMLAFRRAQARELVAGHGLAGRRVLEVGCGEGYFLDLLEEAGAEALGLEAGAATAARGRTRGRRILEGYLEPGARLEGAPFDAFVTINFLEHAPDPAGLLRALRDNLVPGAPGWVEVPSHAHALAADRFYDFIPDHLSYFTGATLRHLLEACGFEVLDLATVWDGYDLLARVRRREPDDCRGWEALRDHLLADLRAFLGTGRVAVWGASHQALTLLALAGATGVRYVVDSAPFKQGRFTPATHLPIHGPEALARDPVDAVLVMAAGYSDEVARILRQDLGFTGTVAVLRGNALEVLP